MDVYAERVKQAYAKIHLGLSKEHEGQKLLDEGRQLWIEGTLELAVTLAEAREQYTSNKEFGEWLGTAGYGPERISVADRWALVSMGKHFDETREVLNQTLKRSPQKIWCDEHPSRVCRAAKTADSNVINFPPREAHTAEPPPPEGTPEPPPRNREARIESLWRKKCERLRKERDKLDKEWAEVTKLLMSPSPSGYILAEHDLLFTKCLHPDHVRSLGEETYKMHERAYQIYKDVYRQRLLSKPRMTEEQVYKHYGFRPPRQKK